MAASKEEILNRIFKFLEATIDNDNLADPRDHAKLHEIFSKLRDLGFEFTPEEVIEEARNHRWKEPALEELDKIINGINSGPYFNDYFYDDIIK